MIDPKEIRNDPERLRKAVSARKADPKKADVDAWLALDAEKKKIQGRIDELNAERNKIKALGKSDPDAARAKGQELRERGKELETQLEKISADWQAILNWFPNWPDPDMPEGAGESDNPEECAWTPEKGYIAKNELGKGDNAGRFMPEFPCHSEEKGYKPLHHLDLGEKLGVIDVKQAGKVSGSRFAYLMGDLALLQMAIQNLMVGELRRRGFSPMIPPLLVRERSLYGTSHFPEGRDQVYQIERKNIEEENDLFLVGSSEPANFSFFMDKTFPEKDLPIKIFAITTCFRSEAGSWGKDVKGIKRVHQFDKLEMNGVCMPVQSKGIYEEFREVNEWLLQQLKLPYRMVDKCGGDAGYLATSRQRDAEVWLSGAREFMEVMTDTNTTDYQARRLNIRYRAADNSSGFCHTVNDTGCAMGRMLIAILDNYQQKDGSVKIPEILRAFMKKDFLKP